jgi:hypothetical protein
MRSLDRVGSEDRDVGDAVSLATTEAALAFIEQHGIVLERAKGTVPSLVHEIVGAPVQGSWWAHPDAHRIFAILGAVHDSPDVLRCRLIDGKVTYAHRRVWPALVRMETRLPAKGLDRHAQEHTPSGAHRTVITAFPKWVPAEVLAEAKKLSVKDALAAVAPFVP